jgi:3',5'-cyclic-AMP phosphodiesterase
MQVANDGRNPVVATRSIGDPEGGGPGYLILHCHGDDLALTYRTVVDSGPIILITHPRDSLLATGPAHVVRGTALARARIWSSDPLAAVRGCCDADAWTNLEPDDAGDWGFRLPPVLSKGQHSVEVRAIDIAGRTGSQRLEFAADPTGRYTAIPHVRPPVRATQFC